MQHKSSFTVIPQHCLRLLPSCDGPSESSHPDQTTAIQSTAPSHPSSSSHQIHHSTIRLCMPCTSGPAPPDLHVAMHPSSGKSGFSPGFHWWHSCVPRQPGTYSWSYTDAPSLFPSPSSERYSIPSCIRPVTPKSTFRVWLSFAHSAPCPSSSKYFRPPLHFSPTLLIAH